MRKAMSLVICASFFLLNLHAQNNSELSKILDEVKAARVDIQNFSAVFLVVYKQLETNIVTETHSVRVISPMASVRETDLVTAGIISEVSAGTTLPVVKKEGEWFQVQLVDSRTGWIHQDDVQQLYDEDVKWKQLQDLNTENYYQTRLVAENFFRKFSGSFSETEKYITEFENKYNSLSEAGKQNTGNLYKELDQEREIINRAWAYTNHYYRKLPAMQAISPEKEGSSHTIGFDGVVTARLGSSVFESGEQISEITRNLSFAGNIAFNPQSKLTLQLNHNNDVIRTPFTSTDVNATYAMEAAGGTRLRTSVIFRDYADKLFSSNSFRDIGANVNVEQPLGEKTRIIGDVQAQSKMFPDEEINNMQGVLFNTFFDYRGEKTIVNAGVRGRFQSSDIVSLDYHRLMPNLRFTYVTGQKNWSAYAEAEQLAYGSASESNLNRLRVDLERNTPVNRIQLSVTSNLFPNKNNFDLLKFKILTSHKRIATGRNTRSTIYAQYTYYISNESMMSNYIDLRYDGNYSRNTGYIDIGAFGRYWENGTTDHRLSVYSRFGLKFSGIRIGPVVGADILIDPDDPDLERIGNSYRAGVDGSGNFMIQKATIYSSARYQYTFLYSGFSTDGETETRNPMTLEITAGARIPIRKLFDLQFDLRYYSMDFDYQETSEIVPAQNQSGLRFLVGISYRF